jgi:hypothetical protein
MRPLATDDRVSDSHPANDNADQAALLCPVLDVGLAEDTIADLVRRTERTAVVVVGMAVGLIFLPPPARFRDSGPFCI